MIDFIQKTLSIHKKEFLFFPAVSAIMFAFGHLILWLVLLLDNSEDLTSFETGTFMALFGLIFIALFRSMGYASSFNHAVAMSQTRTRTITGLALTSAFECALVIILIYLLNLLERFVCNTVFSEFPLETNMSVIFKPHIMLAIILAFVAFETLFGALYTRLGLKYFWIVWIGFVLLMQLPARIIDKMQENDAFFMHKIIDFLVNCNKIALFSVISCVLLVLIALPYLILKKQRVTMY